eukprot:CAMPEP_0119086652 /NCGR_PEP_ID=MMETSP1178-20130426/138908_1 /TAXON_ID=33656 /ORGANISM="unid sp, Strain CCMP2000" /LENGTH=84 /DNA_ID=CAMNT_0007069805 /DNA_START=245 /DNA_END=499 /DNA_ORIENTATION=+
MAAKAVVHLTYIIWEASVRATHRSLLYVAHAHRPRGTSLDARLLFPVASSLLFCVHVRGGLAELAVPQDNLATCIILAVKAAVT